MHLPLVCWLLLHCKMTANLVLTLQVICISASWSSASLPSLHFFFPYLYSKTHNKVLQTKFYCQWHLHFLRCTDSDTSAYAKYPNCACSSRCGMPHCHWNLWKCSMVLKHGELELEVTLPGLCWCCKRHNIKKKRKCSYQSNIILRWYHFLSIKKNLSDPCSFPSVSSQYVYSLQLEISIDDEMKLFSLWAP